jgi:hypothetical protein
MTDTATHLLSVPDMTYWVNDWDWLDDQWGENAIDIWNSVREQCPVATTERYGRAFMPVTMEAVAAGGQRHRELLVDLGQRRPPRRTSATGAADHLRSTRAPRASAPPAPGVQPEERRPARRPTSASSAAKLIADLDGADTADAAASTPSTSRSTGSASSPVSPRTTPTSSATGSTATSSSVRATTRCAWRSPPRWASTSTACSTTGSPTRETTC